MLFGRVSWRIPVNWDWNYTMLVANYFLPFYCNHQKKNALCDFQWYKNTNIRKEWGFGAKWYYQIELVLVYYNSTHLQCCHILKRNLHPWDISKLFEDLDQWATNRPVAKIILEFHWPMIPSKGSLGTLPNTASSFFPWNSKIESMGFLLVSRMPSKYSVLIFSRSSIPGLDNLFCRWRTNQI